MYNLDALKEVARTIKHCGDYGRCFWNESEQKIFWIAGDSDGSNDYSIKDREARQLNEDDEDYTHTPEQIIEKFKQIPFVKEVEVEGEAGPYDDDDWTEIKYE